MEQRIKYFKNILNSKFLLLSGQNLKCSKSCQLATLESPVGILQILIKIANWQLKSRQLATFWATLILARQNLKIPM